MKDESKIKRLGFPPTLRFPLPNEVPNNVDILADIKKSKSAFIVEGYTFNLKTDIPEHTNLGFEFYAEINIDNSKLWRLFIELTDFLPYEVSLICGHIDDEMPVFGNYANKLEVLKFLHKFKKELTKDVFIYFGLIFQSEASLVEIFVDETKYIKFWGSNAIGFKKSMQNFGLKNIENLNFIDEFPIVRFPLVSIDNIAIETNKLLKELKNEYKIHT